MTRSEEKSEEDATEEDMKPQQHNQDTDEQDDLIFVASSKLKTNNGRNPSLVLSVPSMDPINQLKPKQEDTDSGSSIVDDTSQTEGSDNESDSSGGEDRNHVGDGSNVSQPMSAQQSRQLRETMNNNIQSPSAVYEPSVKITFNVKRRPSSHGSEASDSGNYRNQFRAAEPSTSSRRSQNHFFGHSSSMPYELSIQNQAQLDSYEWEHSPNQSTSGSSVLKQVYRRARSQPSASIRRPPPSSPSNNQISTDNSSTVSMQGCSYADSDSEDTVIEANIQLSIPRSQSLQWSSSRRQTSSRTELSPSRATSQRTSFSNPILDTSFDFGECGGGSENGQAIENLINNNVNVHIDKSKRKRSASSKSRTKSSKIFKNKDSGDSIATSDDKSSMQQLYNQQSSDSNKQTVLKSGDPYLQTAAFSPISSTFSDGSIRSSPSKPADNPKDSTGRKQDSDQDEKDRMLGFDLLLSSSDEDDTVEQSSQDEETPRGTLEDTASSTSPSSPNSDASDEASSSSNESEHVSDDKANAKINIQGVTSSGKHITKQSDTESNRSTSPLLNVKKKPDSSTDDSSSSSSNEDNSKTTYKNAKRVKRSATLPDLRRKSTGKPSVRYRKVFEESPSSPTPEVITHLTPPASPDPDITSSKGSRSPSQRQQSRGVKQSAKLPDLRRKSTGKPSVRYKNVFEESPSSPTPEVITFLTSPASPDPIITSSKGSRSPPKRQQSRGKQMYEIPSSPEILRKVREKPIVIDSASSDDDLVVVSCDVHAQKKRMVKAASFSQRPVSPIVITPDATLPTVTTAPNLSAFQQQHSFPNVSHRPVSHITNIHATSSSGSSSLFADPGSSKVPLKKRKLAAKTDSPPSPFPDSPASPLPDSPASLPSSLSSASDSPASPIMHLQPSSPPFLKPPRSVTRQLPLVNHSNIPVTPSTSFNKSMSMPVLPNDPQPSTSSAKSPSLEEKEKHDAIEEILRSLKGDAQGTSDSRYGALLVCVSCSEVQAPLCTTSCNHSHKFCAKCLEEQVKDVLLDNTTDLQKLEQYIRITPRLEYEIHERMMLSLLKRLHERAQESTVIDVRNSLTKSIQGFIEGTSDEDDFCQFLSLYKFTDHKDISLLNTRMKTVMPHLRCRFAFGDINIPGYTAPPVGSLEKYARKSYDEHQKSATQSAFTLNCGFQKCTGYFTKDELKKTLPDMMVMVIQEKLFKSLSEALNGNLMEGVSQALDYSVKAEVEMKKDFPENWCLQDDTKEYEVYTLDVDCEEYNVVMALFHDSMHIPRAKILTIKRVQNPTQWKIYQLRKEKMIRVNGEPEVEMRLFHGTARSVVQHICRDNFDWRMCGKHGTLLGQGSYFAKDAAYSHRFTDNGRILPPASVMNMINAARQGKGKLPPPLVAQLKRMRSNANPPPAHSGHSKPPPAHSNRTPAQSSHAPAHSSHAPAHSSHALAHSSHAPAHSSHAPAHSSLAPAHSSHRPAHSNQVPANLTAVPVMPNSNPVPPHLRAVPVPSSSSNNLYSVFYGAGSNLFSIPNTNSSINMNSNIGTSSSSASSMPSSFLQGNNTSSFLTGPNPSIYPWMGASSSATLNPNMSINPAPNVNLPSTSNTASSLGNPFPGTSEEKRYTQHTMFLARVLTGSYCKGQPSMKKPPPYNAPYNQFHAVETLGRTFDSCVDNEVAPTMFVVYDHAQSYPEYIIEYQNEMFR